MSHLTHNSHFGDGVSRQNAYIPATQNLTCTEKPNTRNTQYWNSL